MAKVIVKPITSFWDVSKSESDFIDQIMSAKAKNYWHVPSYRVGSWDGLVRMWNPKSKTLPSGLVSDCVEELERFGYEVEEHHEKLRDLNPRPEAELYYSIEAHHQLVMLQAMLDNKRGVVSAATNSGKTKVAQAWCAMHDLKTLYLVPSKELLEQTLESFRKDTNLDVGFISSEKGWQIGEDVTICLASSVAKRKSSRSGKVLNEKAVKKFRDVAKQFEAVIVDECHHMTGETWRWILKQLKQAHYRFGLSGTPWEEGNKVEEFRVKSLLGPQIATVKNEDLIEIGWSAKPKIHMLSYRQDKLPEGSFDDYAEIYDHGIVYNDFRNSLIVKLCDRLVAQNKSCLVISVRIPHCRIISDLLNTMGIDYRLITGRSEKFSRKQHLQDFKEGKFPVLVSNVLSEGVDVPSLNALIFASGGKSYKKILQRVGRGIRKKPSGENSVEIYDFVDKGHKYLKSHTSQRMKVYKLENFEILTVDET